MNKTEWRIFNQLSVSLLGAAQMQKAQGRVFDAEKETFNMAHSFIVARRKFLRTLSELEQRNIDLFDMDEPENKNQSRHFINSVNVYLSSGVVENRKLGKIYVSEKFYLTYSPNTVTISEINNKGQLVETEQFGYPSNDIDHVEEIIQKIEEQ